MKVRCIRQFDAMGTPIATSAWLTTGVVYHVLEIVSDREGTKFRILGDEKNTPAYQLASQFEIVTNSIPKCWVVTFADHNFLMCAPAAWRENGFWDRFFDRDPAAINLFNETFKQIVTEDP